MKKVKKRSNVCRNAAEEFCANTSLHGYKFIVAKNTHTYERILWFLLVIASLIASLIVSWIAWSSYNEMPTQTVTDSTHNPIWNYYFPAVTLCNLNKISRKKAFNLASKLKRSYDLSSEELAWQLRSLFQLVSPNNERIPDRNLTRLQDLLEVNGLEAHTVLKDLAPGCDLIQKCIWKGESKRCETMIEQIATTEGFCCAFNYFGIKNHQFSGLYSKKAPTNPRRVSACGYNTALEVIAENLLDDYHATQIPSTGYKILIHFPYDFPDWGTQFMLLSQKTVTFLSSAPELTYSSTKLRTLDVQTRNCLFPEEREMEIFDRYTHHNCMNECRMKLVRRLCSCVPFYYYNQNELVINSVPGFDPDTVTHSHVWGEEKSACDCLPDCEYSTYPYEASSGEIISKHSNKEVNLFRGLNISSQTAYRVFFNDLTATRNRRDVYYNWHTLLALFGGILGLFVGFSLVSGLELLYFFTIRILIEFILERKRNKTNQVTVLNKERRNLSEINYDLDFGLRRRNSPRFLDHITK